MLDRIAAEGEDALDRVLKKDEDRELLYRRFSAYRPFAQGYRCPLDTNAELAEERAVELAPGRLIRFIRLNSALAFVRRNDEEGKLLLGERQRVLPQRIGRRTCPPFPPSGALVPRFQRCSRCLFAIVHASLYPVMNIILR